jgi:hypothetical protein
MSVVHGSYADSQSKNVTTIQMKGLDDATRHGISSNIE